MGPEDRSRRRLLLGLTGAMAGVAGCTGGIRGVADGLGGFDGDDDASTSGTTNRPTEPPADSLAQYGRPSTICESDILPGIDGIAEPAFAGDWGSVAADNEFVIGEPRLTEEHAVVGLVDGDRARAYPIDAFWRHEVVNDDFGGPVLVTYCPICRSGMVASRVVDGETLTFDASGQLWVPPEVYTRASEYDGDVFAAERRGIVDADESVRNSGNLVMYDLGTESYWSQMIGTAICGPYTGTELTMRPSTLATWGDWRSDHPETDVLLPAPHSKRF